LIVTFIFWFVVTHFWVPTKKKYKKKIYDKKIFGRKKKIGARKGYLNAEKRLKLVEEVKKCKRLKFDSIFLTGESPVDKKNSI